MRRYFASLVVRNAACPVRVYADWTELISASLPIPNLGSAEDVVLDLQHHPSSPDSVLNITIPRRISSVEIDAQAPVSLAAKDKLEVEKHLMVTSHQGDIAVGCAIRAHTIELQSVQSEITVDKAIEAVRLVLRANSKVTAQKRVSAVSELVLQANSIELASLYCLGSSDVAAVGGDVLLGPTHGTTVNVQASHGNVRVQSLSGSCHIVAPKGSVGLHFDASIGRSTIQAGNKVDVSLAVDALPMRVTGMVPNLDAKLIRYDQDNGFTVLGGEEGKPVNELHVQTPIPGGDIKLESWIDNVLKNMKH
ncbi:hypothetical protein BASA81_005587 [Batrachochytrium salamandrivorans]|nr:hypothetical protein BASA81_005587 [Batrachochytrium salamandrivorans]